MDKEQDQKVKTQFIKSQMKLDLQSVLIYIYIYILIHKKPACFRSLLTFFWLSKWEPASTAFDKEQDDIDRAHIN